MRLGLLSLTLIASFAIPAAAHADTFSFVSNDGNTTFSGTIPAVPSTIFPVGVIYQAPATSNIPGTVTSFEFADPAVYMAVGDPGFDFVVATTLGSYDYTGPIVFVAGTEAAPVFLPGAYNLAGILGTTPGVLTITTSATPEPSSLVLLGTGILSVAGAARRRLLKA